MNGIITEINLPVSRTTTENIAWKLPMPSLTGSTPIFWGDRIFLNVAENGSFLWAVDRYERRADLEAPSQRPRQPATEAEMSTPSPVPTVNVWVMTGTGILKAFDFSGKELWMRDIQNEYGRFGLKWGYGSSPLLLRRFTLLQVLHGMKTDDPSYMLRMSKATGARSGARMADHRAARVAGLVHDARDRAARQQARVGHYRRRCGDRS